jgi:hypothetical protein
MNTRVPARRKPEETGQLGEAMRKLLNARWRALVEFYLLEKPGRGAQNRGGRGVPVRRKATSSIAYPGHLRLLLSDRPSRSTDDGLNAVLHVTNDDLALRVALLHSGL